MAMAVRSLWPDPPYIPVAVYATGFVVNFFVSAALMFVFCPYNQLDNKFGAKFYSQTRLGAIVAKSTYC